VVRCVAVRHRYRKLDPALIGALRRQLDLRRLFQELLLLSGSEVEEALEWMRELRRQGHLPADLDLEDFARSLEEDRTLSLDADGQRRLARAGQRQIRRRALEEIFRGLRRGGPGAHAVRDAGVGQEALPETRPYRFGDEPHRIEPVRSLWNSLHRNLGELRLGAEDLEVQETEQLTSSATVLAIDVSYSMVFYGEDRLTPAKKVALALTELIETRYPTDHVEVVMFGDEAVPIAIGDIAALQAGPHHTNTREALTLSRRLLQRRHQPNRQVFLITDGHPTAIREGSRVYRNPWSLDLKIVNRTLEEAEACRRERIVITTFMLATDPNLVDFVDKMTRINRGRAYFASPDALGEFVLADYVRNRRRRVR
jgi:uncharacterized protein with von Willebrand factor type A (vWA) domain